MATNNLSKRPATTLRCGNIKATIWQNVSESGPFFTTTFSRPFKDPSGVWRNATSIGLNDLKALMNVACEAKEWISNQKWQSDPNYPLKEQLLWVRTFQTAEKLRQVLHDWLRLYNEQWLVERHGFRSPIQVRRDLLATPEAA